MKATIKQSLIDAFSDGNFDVAISILRTTALSDLEVKNSEGNTSLIEAAYWGRLDAVKILLEKGSNIEAKNKNGCTPLIVAAGKGRGEVITFLIEKGSQIEARNKDGDTPLMEAASNGQLEAAKILLGKGSHLEATNRYGYTSLILAALYGGADVVKYLLETGANREAKNKEGRTAYYFAKQNGHKKVVQLLESWGKPVPPGASTSSLKESTLLFLKEASVNKSATTIFSSMTNLAYTNESTYKYIREFVCMVYDKAEVDSTKFNKQELVSRCVGCFVTSGYETIQSIMRDCDDINNDDLHLKEDVRIPVKLIIAIYKAIREMRKDPSESVNQPRNAKRVSEREKIKEKDTTEFSVKNILESMELDIVQGKAMRGDTSALFKIDQMINFFISFLENHNLNGDSLLNQLNSWKKEMELDVELRNAAVTVIDQLIRHIERAIREQAKVDAKGEFMLGLTDKMKLLHGEIRKVRSCVTSLSKAYSSFGNVLRNELNAGQNSAVLNCIHEIEATFTKVCLTQKSEKKQIESSLEELNFAKRIIAKYGDIETALSSQTARLNTLQESAIDSPNLMVLLPSLKKGSKKRFNPRNILRDEAKLVFMCAESLQLVPCGESGDGYHVKTSEPWLREAIPVLKVGFSLLQLAVTSTSTGILLPVIGITASSIDQVATNNLFLESAASVLKEIDADVRVESVCPSTESAVDTMRRLEVNSADIQRAYQAISSFLREADPTLKYVGLSQKTNDTGRIVWVKTESRELDGKSIP